MKKYPFYLCLALLIGLFSSCSQDDNDALPADDVGNLVSFTANLPADWTPAPTTRAVPSAPANHTLRCILEIWTSDLATLKVRKELVASGTQDLNFTFKLGEMGDYKVLLWADYIDANAATSNVAIAGLANVEHYPDKYYATDGTSGLQAVQLMAGAATPCELRDGFFGFKDFTKNALPLKNLSVTLARPFAKLTIAEKNKTNYDFCANVAATYTVPKQFNVADGTSEGTYSNSQVSFTPDGSAVDVNGQTCYVLLSDYIFADADGTMSEINLTYTPTAGSGIVFRPFNIPAGVTLQRNKVTQAAGYIIAPETNPSPIVEMTVNVDDQWNTGDNINLDPKVGDYYYKDGTWSGENKSTTNNPILGVIFFIDGDHVFVVSKTQGKSLAWSTENVSLTLGDQSNNKTVTEEILEYATQNNKLDEYPIFKECKNLRDETGLNWYMPASCRISGKLFDNLDQINLRIRDIGGHEIGLPVWLSGQAGREWGRLQVSADAYLGTPKSELHDVIFILDFKYK